MAYEIKYTSVEIPELDAFLKEYDALCQKYGMAFETGEYGYDGGSYTTIGTPSAHRHLNMDYADPSIPCIADAVARAESIRDARHKADRTARAIKAAKEEVILYSALKAKYEPERS